MQQSTASKKQLFIPQDRRNNVFIRSRQRKKFDRRQSLRIGLHSRALFHGDNKSIPGVLKDISDSGACVELEHKLEPQKNTLAMDIPLLRNKKTSCEISWAERTGNNGTTRYGLKFKGLSTKDQKELRKRFLLNNTLLAAHAQETMAKTAETCTKKIIKQFFLEDVKTTLDKLIEIDFMITAQAPPDTIMNACTNALDALVCAGGLLEQSITDTALINDIKRHVRALLGHFIYQAAVFRRGFEKPRGYPGDYQMLEVVYNNQEVSAGIGKYIDRYGLNVPYSVAIRLRKDMMKSILADFIRTSDKSRLTIANLASGGCRDIREMVAQPLECRGKARILCIDQDREALAFSRDRLAQLDTGSIEVQQVQGNILRLENVDIGPDNSLDMVYSIGIADYLQDRMLDKIFKDCYRKLKPGGKLVVAYKDREKHRPAALDWYGDWHFVLRNEEEVINLSRKALGIQNSDIKISREASGIIFFAEITKKGPLTQ
ncbi:MAG: methyltransferase domain-containing protein [Deltaproteobacteria bacterium]|nr:methyltransferase domain-containing protein [Deltaproteobacteria bacterium]